jgi:hypothetical protein
VDFYKLRTKRTKEGLIVYPDFLVQSSKDLLVKGRAFYGIWDEARGLWSRDEMDVARLVDEDLYAEAAKLDAVPLLMNSYQSRSWREYKNYITTLDDSTADLDLTLSFADEVPDRKKYTSKKLPYALVDTPAPAWDELVGTLYSPEEKEKIEWCIGSIISGDSKKNQKFAVFYGPPGSGKSTVMSIIERLFEGYFIPFDAKAITTSGAAFSMAGFKHNPLVAIQHDGDLSHIEDNSKLNSIVSHELLSINEKYKSEFYSRAYAFLFLATNEPVRITGSKSGIIRRLIDIHPSGVLISNKHYHILLNQIDFELGAIAQQCLGVYYALGKNHYSGYKPTLMMYETDVMFNFIEHIYDLLYTKDGIALDKAWQLYKEFCEDALIRHKMQRHQFRSELMQYFDKFEERTEVDGIRVRSYYSGLKTHRFVKVDESIPLSLVLDEKASLLDDILADMPAQYATSSGIPEHKWDEVKTTLKDLDTNELHYVQVPEQHIVIDFDLKDEHGDKSQERNLEAAAEWPPTYAEYSQGGSGVHLHYIWIGDVSELKAAYSEGIEVKTLLGNSSLRRKVSGCNAVPIAIISSGLPLKEVPVQDNKVMANEKSVRELIVRNLKKEIHPGTKPSIDFIKTILDEAFDSGIPYDVSDLYPDVYSFAMSSTNHARYCTRLVQEMPFQSSDSLELNPESKNDRIAFYDVEVFPNLFIICWKFAGEANIVKMINPSSQEVDELLSLKLVGFNCRRYDNHILYAAAMGYSNEQLHDLSQRIISGDRSAMFGAAYDLSYTDVYDFSMVKQSLKKWEIDLGIHHMELGLPWLEPVPEERWLEVAEYCANDVIATEATFEARQGDWHAREILSTLSTLSVNHSTQQHAARIIFGNEKKPQREFLYTDLSEMFPGYKYDFGKSTYKEELVGEGGYVYAEPGVYKNVALLDVASMHPTSIELLKLFGPYTDNFSDLKQARIAIKRGALDEARRMLDGKLAPFLDDKDQAKELSDALKIAINIVYGLTSAKFENAFKDQRNKDNIVAKRGALFMIDLKYAVQEQGFTVAHIKTDSIKIPDATPEIIEFVFEFGRQYGYEFEHEATFDEFVLFNDAVYIAKEGDTWSATGAQFQHPYVFKTLLSHEEVTFDDLCETRNVVKGTIHISTPDGLRFIGRIGRFVPIKEGTNKGEGQLLRVNEDKQYAVTGTKGWLWLEAEKVRDLELEDAIDMSYFEEHVTKAQESLRVVGYI